MNDNKNININKTNWINSYPKIYITQGQTYHKYYLKINIFYFEK